MHLYVDLTGSLEIEKEWVRVENIRAMLFSKNAKMLLKNKVKRKEKERQKTEREHVYLEKKLSTVSNLLEPEWKMNDA